MLSTSSQALVELDGEPFKCFASQREDWALYDLYRSPGPLQVRSTHSLTNQLPLELNASASPVLPSSPLFLCLSPISLQIAFDPHSVDLSITTTLELNRGVDVRMSPERWVGLSIY